MRARRDASIVQAASAVGDGRADALVSAGSTGPTLAAGTLAIKRIRGVFRPALAVLLPLPHGDVLLLDAGASVEVRPEHLVQFAYMGACFMEAVHGVERPRVGLLSVGEESGKGTPDVLTAHERLERRRPQLRGQRRGLRPAHLRGRRDRDRRLHRQRRAQGARGIGQDDERRGARRASAPARSPSLGGLLVRGKLAGLREQLDPERAGGAILLGLRKPVVVAHGTFGPRGIENAVRLARRAVDEDMVARTTAALEAAGALRSAPAARVAGP